MRPLIAATLIASFAAPALAQDGDALATPPLRLDHRLAPAADPAFLAEVAPAVTLPGVPGRGMLSSRRVLPTVVGAVLGGWIGYVASQVSRSDWDKEENGDFASMRLGFAAGGAVLGAVTGNVLGKSFGGPTSSLPPRQVRGAEHNLITSAEIEQSTARNAFELIRNLRPRWLQVRGTTSFGEAGRGGSVGRSEVAIEPGESSIKVYLNNTRLGDINVLRTLDKGSFSEIRFYDSAAATYRWGQGHFGGAIEILTAAPGL